MALPAGSNSLHSAVSLSFPSGFALVFFSFSFQEATCSPCSRHQKVSHLLPITFGCSWLAASHLGQCGVSARSSLPRRHWGRDGGEGREAGIRVNWVGRLYWRIAKGWVFSWHCNPQPGNSSQREGHPWKCESWSWLWSAFGMGTVGLRKSFSIVIIKQTRSMLVCK